MLSVGGNLFIKNWKTKNHDDAVSEIAVNKLDPDLLFIHPTSKFLSIQFEKGYPEYFFISRQLSDGNSI